MAARPFCWTAGSSAIRPRAPATATRSARPSPSATCRWMLPAEQAFEIEAFGKAYDATRGPRTPLRREDGKAEGMSDAVSLARDALAHHPLPQGLSRRDRAARRAHQPCLRGRTTLCLRIPGKGTEEYIDRANEAVAARAAAAAGVSPRSAAFRRRQRRHGDALRRRCRDHVAGRVQASDRAARRGPAKPSASCTTAARNSRFASNCLR